MRAPRLRVFLWALLAAPLGCVEPFQTPSAYDEQRNLCDPALAAVYQTAVDHCRADGTDVGRCAGIMSFHGKLEGRPVTVESTLSRSSIGVLPVGPDFLLDEVELDGSSPYFNFVAKVQSIGGDENLGDAVRHFDMAAAPNTLADPLSDSLVRVALRLTGSDTVGFAGAPGGKVVITRQLATEVAGTFDGTFGANTDTLQGCFTVFPLSRRIEDAPAL